MLEGKKILVGITGGIAAYKTATIVRLLVKEGAEVKVIMTTHAKEFITPLTLSVLSKNQVLSDFFDQQENWNSHIDLGLWADLFLIAPATANSIARMANGIADNLLVTTYLSARCPVFIAPSMDMDMLKHPSTTVNIETLKAYGNIILEPAEGELASGLSGKGRMAEPEEIVREINDFLSKKKIKKPLSGKKVLINAGPTHESIDPVRYISNHSTGKMGIALADAASAYGAEVELVLGPVSLKPEDPSIIVTNVTNAAEMAAECIERFNSCDIAILAAAVADFTPQLKSESKIKRGSEELALRLIPTTDIAAAIGKKKKRSQLLVGFALETTDGLSEAFEKLQRKKLDLIILNSLREKGAGFGYDTNRITIIDKNNNIHNFELKSKAEAARDILDMIVSIVENG